MLYQAVRLIDIVHTFLNYLFVKKEPLQRTHVPMTADPQKAKICCVTSLSGKKNNTFKQSNCSMFSHTFPNMSMHVCVFTLAVFLLEGAVLVIMKLFSGTEKEVICKIFPYLPFSPIYSRFLIKKNKQLKSLQNRYESYL